MIKKIKSFLTENKTLGQTVIKNTFWMSFGQIASRLIRAILIIYAARVLGAAGYGAFSYALSLAGLFTIFSDIGLTTFLTRESAKSPELRQQYIAAALAVKLALIVISSLLIIFALPLITKIPEAAALFPIIAVLFAFDTLRDFSFAITRSLEKMEVEAGINIAANTAILGLGLAVLLASPSAKNLTIAYTLGAGFGFGLAFWKLRQYFLGFWKFFRKELIKPILTQAWPLGLATLLNVLMLNTDTIMLGWFRTAEEVGFYSAAQRIIVLLYVLPGFLGVSVFPVLSRLVAEPEKFRAVFEKSLRAVVLTTLPIFVGGFIVAPEIINLLFGAEYAATAPVFQIILLTVLLVFPGTIIGYGLFAYNKQKILLWSSGSAALANAVLNFFLIPVYGIFGAAGATIATQLISNIFNFRVMKKTVVFKTFSQFWKIIAATLIMAAAVAGLKILTVHVIAIIIAGAAFYLICLYLFREPTLAAFLNRLKFHF